MRHLLARLLAKRAPRDPARYLLIRPEPVDVAARNQAIMMQIAAGMSAPDGPASGGEAD